MLRQVDDVPKLIDDRYLGDGVYASFDGYHIVLDTRAQPGRNVIALEPSVMKELDRFQRDLLEAALAKGK